VERIPEQTSPSALLLTRSDSFPNRPLEAGYVYRIGAALDCEIRIPLAAAYVARIEPRIEKEGKAGTKLVLHYIPYWEDGAGICREDVDAATVIDVGDSIEHGGVSLTIEDPTFVPYPVRAGASLRRLAARIHTAFPRLASTKHLERICAGLERAIAWGERFESRYIPLRRVQDRKIARMTADLHLARAGGRRHHALLARLSAVTTPASMNASSAIVQRGRGATHLALAAYLALSICLLAMSSRLPGAGITAATLLGIAGFALVASITTYFCAVGASALLALCGMAITASLVDLGDPTNVVSVILAGLCFMMYGSSLERAWRPIPHVKVSPDVTHIGPLTIAIVILTDPMKLRGNPLVYAFVVATVVTSLWGLVVVSMNQTRVLDSGRRKWVGAAGELTQLAHVERMRALTLLDAVLARWRRELIARVVVLTVGAAILLGVFNAFGQFEQLGGGGWVLLWKERGVALDEERFSRGSFYRIPSEKCLDLPEGMETGLYHTGVSEVRVLKPPAARSVEKLLEPCRVTFQELMALVQGPQPITVTLWHHEQAARLPMPYATRIHVTRINIEDFEPSFELMSALAYPAFIFAVLGGVILWHASSYGATALVSGLWALACGAALLWILVMLPFPIETVWPLPLLRVLDEAWAASVNNRGALFGWAWFLLSFWLFFALAMLSALLTVAVILVWGLAHRRKAHAMDDTERASFAHVVVLLIPFAYLALVVAHVSNPQWQDSVLVGVHMVTGLLLLTLLWLVFRQNIWNLSRGRTFATVALAFVVPAAWSGVEDKLKDYMASSVLHPGAVTLFMGGIVVLLLLPAQAFLLRCGELWLTRGKQLSSEGMARIVKALDPHSRTPKKKILEGLLDGRDFGFSGYALYVRSGNHSFALSLDRFRTPSPSSLTISQSLQERLCETKEFMALPWATRDWRVVVNGPELWRLWRRFGNSRCLIFPVHVAGRLRAFIVFGGTSSDYIRSEVAARRLHEICVIATGAD
jgi:hypothetical protein